MANLFRRGVTRPCFQYASYGTGIKDLRRIRDHDGISPRLAGGIARAGATTGVAVEIVNRRIAIILIIARPSCAGKIGETTNSRAESRTRLRFRFTGRPPSSPRRHY